METIMLLPAILTAAAVAFIAGVEASDRLAAPFAALVTRLRAGARGRTPKPVVLTAAAGV